jgi:hypothetical protein
MTAGEMSSMISHSFRGGKGADDSAISSGFPRNIDREDGASGWPILRLHPAGVLLDDASGDGEPETGAAANLLVVKNGSKMRVRILRGDSGSGVGDADCDKFAFVAPEGRERHSIASSPPLGMA